MRARSVLFTLLGDVVRPAGGEAWLGAITRATDTLGVTPQATRTALHRMAAEGWVEPRRVGRHAAYRLTARGVDRLEQAAARIYRLRAAPWDGRWRLLLVTDPTAAGDPAEAARALRWTGFGHLRDGALRDGDLGGTWVSPHDHGDRLDALLAAHGLTDGTLAFVTPAGHGPSAADRRLAAGAWDLAALRDAHAAFLARWADVPTASAHTPRDAFVLRVRLVHDWRRFLFLDPGLPAALLPDDWLGDAAADRFKALYDAVAGPAQDWWATVADAAEPAGSPAGSPAGGSALDARRSA